MNALFEGNLSVRKSANKGYSATCLDWVIDTKHAREEGGTCDDNFDDDETPVVDHIWPVAQKIISEAVKLVTPC